MKSNVMTDAVLYARVSSKEQAEEGFSIPAQRHLLRSYAQREGLEIIVEFSDDETAKSTGRTGFGQMLAFFREHPDMTTLLVEKVDRLTRNFDDYGTLKRLGLTIHFVKEGTILHPKAHSSVRLFTGMRVLMAENYSENLSEEVKKGMHEKAKEGGWPSCAPVGYQNIKGPIGIEPHPKDGPALQHLFTLAATGKYSLKRLATMGRELGLRGRYGAPIQKSALARILQHTAYMGEFTWGGITYLGKYEPLITRALFDEVQYALGFRSKPRARAHEFTFAGLLRCAGCDGLLTGDLKKGKYTYYFCTGCEQRTYYPERTFEEQTIALLNTLAVDQAVSAWLLDDFAAWYDETTTAARMSATRTQARLTELQRLQAQAYEDKLTGAITEAFWRERTTTWREEERELRTRLATEAPNMRKDELLNRASEQFELLQAARDEYVTQSPAERAKLLKLLVSNCTVRAGSLDFAMRSPFNLIKQAAETGDWRRRCPSNTPWKCFRRRVLSDAANADTPIRTPETLR
jgi:site-specific DNA recombinase